MTMLEELTELNRTAEREQLEALALAALDSVEVFAAAMLAEVAR